MHVLFIFTIYQWKKSYCDRRVCMNLIVVNVLLCRSRLTIRELSKGGGNCFLLLARDKLNLSTRVEFGSWLLRKNYFFFSLSPASRWERKLKIISWKFLGKNECSTVMNGTMKNKRYICYDIMYSTRYRVNN